MFLYGKNSVYERLKTNPQTIRQLYLAKDFSEPRIVALAKTARIPLNNLSSKVLSLVKTSANPQGVIADVEEFKFKHLEDLFNCQPALSLVFLDRICDPQNLGAIIRSLACLGGFGLVLPKHKACGITETVLHIACGGENYLPIALTVNLSNALLAAKEQGFWLVGAEVAQGQIIYQADLPFPLALVLGSEEQGVRYGVAKHLDLKVKIPMFGQALSLNVATATSICAYEINRQRSKG